MDEFHGSATTHVEAPASAVFDTITDIERLPEWNAAVERVIEAPATMDEGAQWVVVIHPKHIPSWHSRATLVLLDRQGLQFAYRSQTDDGNASHAEWHWTVVPSGEGADLTVQWDVYPMTLGRKLLAAPMRKAQLVGEVAASLESLARLLTTTRATNPDPAGP